MWVKICGIREEAGLQAVVAAGANAVGLNFYQQSPRHVDVERAAELTAMLPQTVEAVGLFVNEAPENIVEVCRRCCVNLVQLHGDETPETLARLHEIDATLRVIRAFRVGDDGLGEVDNFLRRIDELNLKLFACLIDARAENVYGGSGQRAPWELLAAEYDVAGWPPMILAGGLMPKNVRDAIETVHPWGVDVAGGVESSPGTKDAILVDQFVQNARET